LRIKEQETHLTLQEHDDDVLIFTFLGEVNESSAAVFRIDSA